MLKQLTVSNIGLVRQLDLSLAPGLTVLTGESGAGKSLLLAALGLVLGDRAQSNALRVGEERAEVSAEFDLSAQPTLLEALREQALDATDSSDPTHCLLRRVVHREGRSRAFINDSPITQAGLRAFASQLVDIHGQHDSYRLGQREVQRTLLDDYGCKAEDLATARDSYRRWQAATETLQRLTAEATAKADRRSLLTYQLEELNALELTAGEFIRLEAEFRRVAQAQQLADGAQAALSTIEADPTAAALRSLKALRDDSTALTAAIDCLASAQDLIAEAGTELRSYLDSLEADPEAEKTLEARLGILHDAARKHRVAPEQLDTQLESLNAELASLANLDADTSAASAAVTQTRTSFEQAAKRLSQQRRKAARTFTAAVTEHMRLLGIKDGNLSIAWLDQEGEHGLENLEFHVVTNAGGKPAPLKQVASGGEQARISLAIAIVAAASTALPCLVLDEADVGVGGISADTVGRLLRKLAEHSQVLCITHAPQVAVLGHRHLRVFKDTAGTHIEQLEGDERQEEIARMLAGAEVTSESRAYASTLLRAAAS